jgi:hypothetical protein
MAKRSATDNQTATAPPGDRPRLKERAAFYLPVEVIERANRAAYWLRMTVSDVAAEALTEYLDRVEKKEGGAFKPAPPPRRGRPAMAR